MRLREDARRAAPGGRAGFRAVDRPQAPGVGGIPGGFPARPGGAVPAADRRRGRRRRVRGVHPLVPGEGRVPGRRGGGADPDPDHRVCRGRVRRDDAALRPAGEKKYVHGAFTERYSAFWLGTRSLDAMQDAGILPGFAGIVVSDRYQNYFHPRWEHIAGNQACLSHLLRDYQDCAESYPGAVWPAQAQRALRGLIHAWHAARELGLDAIPAGVRNPLEHEFRHAVLAGLASVPRVPGPKNGTKQRPGRELLEFCRDRRSDVLLFAEDTSVWPTNNISERGVRPLKTQQKISGRLASDDITQDRLDIRGYIDTARKHGRNAFAVLCDLMLGTPWQPPAQAIPP